MQRKLQWNERFVRLSRCGDNLCPGKLHRPNGDARCFMRRRWNLPDGNHQAMQWLRLQRQRMRHWDQQGWHVLDNRPVRRRPLLHRRCVLHGNYVPYRYDLLERKWRMRLPRRVQSMR